ncbi:hypothetical protein GLOIN_2v1880126 [Rhizophagus clarus]|nr:hypothetical protein GLOIN_2v1880126 [Rhizophagus clarus]
MSSYKTDAIMEYESHLTVNSDDTTAYNQCINYCLLFAFDEKGAIIIVDYKMKILPKSARETKNAFFGKKVIESLEIKPDWVTFLSDNDSHYHNADLMLILEHWSEWYNIMVKKWVFLEAEEAKTSINSHHIQVCIDCSNNLGNHYYYLLSYWLQISHAINRYIWLEFDINEGVDIKNTIQGICGTSVAYLESERKRKNSNWYEWFWPTEVKIAQFEKRPLKKPNLQVSDHSIPTSNWNMPLPHKSKINTSHLTIKELKKQLKKYGVDTDISNNRIVLAEILQNKLNDEISQ